MKMHLSSPAFTEGQTIPVKYTCDGDDVSPPIEWSGEPAGTKSVALICDDPDAPSGCFTHWVLYDIDARTHKLPEGASNVGTAGQNSFSRTGFGGPCPPAKDAAHRYFFHVYALDVESIGKPGLSREAVAAAMLGHVLAEGELMAKYQRHKH
jgi:Raf kinase inhibitor-like YbhB/YbcL family protein